MARMTLGLKRGSVARNKQAMAFLPPLWARLHQAGRALCSAVPGVGEKPGGFKRLAKRLEDLELLISEKSKQRNNLSLRRVLTQKRVNS